MDVRLEAVVLPVSDVDRAKDFYKGLGWREDADFAGDGDYRIVQLTPPGSACSIQRSPRACPDGSENSMPTMDVAALAELLRETEQHHGRYEPTAPKHQWSDWYAAYMVARQQGRTPDEAYEDAVAAVETARG